MEFPRYMVLFVCWVPFAFWEGVATGGCDGDILFFFHGHLVSFHGVDAEGVLGGVLFYLFLGCMFFFLYLFERAGSFFSRNIIFSIKIILLFSLDSFFSWSSKTIGCNQSLQPK